MRPTARIGRPAITRERATSTAITRVLRSPLAMTVKGVFRDVWWSWYGRRITNPPLTEGVRSILFVCLGNICRSPFAAMLAALRASERGLLDLRIASAGTRANQAGQAPREACMVAAESFGVSLENHIPQLLDRDMLESHDLIVVMEPDQRHEISVHYPELVHRILLLSLFDEHASGFERFHIEDPFQRPRAVFEACFARIDRTVRNLLDAVERTRRIA